MNYKLMIEYDGKNYSGWQKNKNADKTIQGKLENLLKTLTNENVQVIGSGRTDKGVHARGQIANVHLDADWDVKELQNQINHYLPADINVCQIQKVDERFHSRHSAQSKVYCYTFHKSYEGTKPVFDRDYVTLLEKPLSMNKVQKGIALLKGQHDFKGFSSDKTKKSTVREIIDIRVEEKGSYIRFYVEGDGFLYNMVRIIIGTLIEIGHGKRDIESIKEVFETGNRALAGYTAPAQGLSLYSVDYDETHKKG